MKDDSTTVLEAQELDTHVDDPEMWDDLTAMLEKLEAWRLRGPIPAPQTPDVTQNVGEVVEEWKSIEGPAFEVDAVNDDNEEMQRVLERLEEWRKKRAQNAVLVELELLQQERPRAVERIDDGVVDAVFARTAASLATARDARGRVERLLNHEAKPPPSRPRELTVDSATDQILGAANAEIANLESSLAALRKAQDLDELDPPSPRETGS